MRDYIYDVCLRLSSSENPAKAYHGVLAEEDPLAGVDLSTWIHERGSGRQTSSPESLVVSIN